VIISGSIEHFSDVVSHVVAPAFLLGAVASFISIQIARMDKVVDRIRNINGTGHKTLNDDLPRLRRRIQLLHQSLILSVSSGIAAGVLIVTAFVAVLFSFQHVWLFSSLFVLSLTLLCCSLVLFALEVKIGLNEYDLQNHMG
jgi:hypothetical protein